MRTMLVRPLCAMALLVAVLAPAPASGHCDTLEGPVVTAARQALESGELQPLLRWVGPGDEAEVSAAFAQARAVRQLSPEARGLADHWFFETVVRVHRAGEGMAFTGIAPPGTPVDPAIAAVDAALASGKGDELARSLAAEVETAVRARFAALQAARAHADESVEKGREAVAAYVSLTHFAEGVHAMAAGPPEHHETPARGHETEHRP